MFNYKTIEEKAKEWGVTSRHAQYLCKESKVEGAVKRAGVWFIPDDAPCPIKNVKNNDKPFIFSGTKKKIFESSITLITQKGYENVSMSDIAERVGIRQSAVYNHFKSKHEILNTIYDFYHYHYVSTRPTIENLEELLQEGTILDLITKGFIYVFDKDVLTQMADITKIITQRASTDTRAKELFQDLYLETGVSFVKEGLDLAVAVGKIPPTNTQAIAVLINCIRLYTLLWWIISPPTENYMRMLEDEEALYKLTAFILSMGRPSNL